jgi:hypothetical protein
MKALKDRRFFHSSTQICMYLLVIEGMGTCYHFIFGLDNWFKTVFDTVLFLLLDSPYPKQVRNMFLDQ